MTTTTRLSLLGAGILIAIGLVLLWPITGSERWEITLDEKLAAGKASYLARRSAQAADKGPNILLMLADDLGRYDLSLYGDTAATTPNIDALASEGVHFTTAYATAAICAPSRAARGPTGSTLT